VQHMADLSSAEIKGAARETMNYQPIQQVEIPEWI
jgi:hypothetical protein